MPDLDAVIAANVRAHRLRRGWRQSDLARRMNFSSTTICDLETGRRRLQAVDLPLLCRVFDVPLIDLLTDADPADMNALRLRSASPQAVAIPAAGRYAENAGRYGATHRA